MTPTLAPRLPAVAVVVAHPGHELIIYQWMAEHRPIYCCLTDGSGGAAMPRLASTTQLLKNIGASVGPIYGRYSDREVYRLLLEKRVDVFVALAEELASALEERRVDSVAGDAVEGFNPVHDVCRLIIDGAVRIVRRRTGRDLRNYDFLLNGPPDPSHPDTIVVQLDEAALERKLAAAKAYHEMRAEVEGALDRHGRETFAIECLRPVTRHLDASRFERELPGYELFGERRVREGRYREIIRYRDHLRPIVAAIGSAAE